MRVLDVTDDQDRLVVRVESVPDVAGCPVCGVVAHAHDRDEVGLVDAPSFGSGGRCGWCGSSAATYVLNLIVWVGLSLSATMPSRHRARS